MARENVTKEVAKILVVDDVDANRFVLRDIIQEMEYQPVLAENGMQALKVIDRIHPQLIILDIAMPEMDGYEFCKLMKENPQTRDIPIIFISAFDDPSDVVRGFDLGGEDYITKPFIPKVVKARLRLHLKLYDANKEMQEMNRRLQTSVGEQLHQLEMEKKNVLYALLRVARENACYDKDHMERLCYNCRILAEAMQLSADYGHLISDAYIDTIELAAPLCDLGNVAIPTELLQKKESLTPEDVEVIRTHAAVGAKILQDIKDTGDYNDFLQMSIDIAHYHHENWDGSGYPCGKKGDEIPLSAQIVSVVSAYCAMTENRAYRDSYHIEKALSMMEADAGTKFNPGIFQILRKIYRQLH
ncbi:MAG: response regulator [Roseburia sp.]|nr:response regulator [Roseburia sp.]MCM1241435.1 response regulator [Roseburia sp.]